MQLTSTKKLQATMPEASEASDDASSDYEEEVVDGEDEEVEENVTDDDSDVEEEEEEEDISDGEDSGEDEEENDDVENDNEEDKDEGDADKEEDNDGDGEDGDDEDEGDEDDKLQGLAGMADVISKILAKPGAGKKENKKETVLVKCQRTNKRTAELKEEIAAKKAKRKEKSELLELNHVLPTRSNAPTEALLKRIATKGVVKLFNAVSAHQKTVQSKLDEAGTESRKAKTIEKVSKDDFLDMLKSKDSMTNNIKTEEIKQEEKGTKKKKKKKQGEADEDADDAGESQATWKVFRDDFMMTSKMKDWDKSDSDDNEDGSGDGDEDGTSDDE